VAEGSGFGWLPESLAGWCVKPDTLLDVLTTVTDLAGFLSFLGFLGLASICVL